MNDLEKELYDYILNRKYLCCFCNTLKEEVRKSGLSAIADYRGMICGSIEDMMERYLNVKHGLKHDTPVKKGDPDE